VNITRFSGWEIAVIPDIRTEAKLNRQLPSPVTDNATCLGLTTGQYISRELECKSGDPAT